MVRTLIIWGIDKSDKIYYTNHSYYKLLFLIHTMSLKHVLLALLAEEPSHGYELKKRYDDALGTLWPVQQAQIYNNLRLLEKGGEIVLETRVEQENLPDQKLYSVTPRIIKISWWPSNQQFLPFTST